MRRFFFFTLKLALVVVLAVWFVNHSGPAHIVWNNYAVDTSAGFLGLCALVGGWCLYRLMHVYHLLRRGPENWRLRRKLKSWRQGHDHLTQGLVAVAGGDAFEAGRRAVHARRLLGSSPATQLLQAQAAQLAGDYRSAQEIFRGLATEPLSAVLGYRGLIMEARRAGNWVEMERLVEKLHRLRPETPWLNLLRFELLARRHSWEQAGVALRQASEARLLEPIEARRHRSAMRAAAAQDEAMQGLHDSALQSAELAVREAPGFLPAILVLAGMQKLKGNKRAMLRLIEKTWKKQTHPQLAELWRGAESDAVENFKRMEKLCLGTEERPGSQLALADAAFAADIWGAARRHLTALISGGSATQGAYRLMARLERRETSNERSALQWLVKAHEAPADPAWLCRSCGGSHGEWQGLCAHCGDFNSLDWRSPGVSSGAPAALGMREPVIVGEPLAQ